MAFKPLILTRIPRIINTLQNHWVNIASLNTAHSTRHIPKSTEYKTEQNYIYLEDPDCFGNLTNKTNIQDDTLRDEGDIIEQEYLENVPLRSQKLTIKQYADIIKQYLKHKRLKDAIDVLEVRMLSVDRVKPVNYIYNILIGGCAEVGYTKKAFKLYNDMKRRALKASGDTYTCLFHACANSPWRANGLKHAQNLRALMAEKSIEPNLTNYNAMIKAFGRCGDLTTAFQIVDEMISKRIKIRVHTFNHLLHACIADKESGLRHALIVWRKMLRMKERPNIYSFNLMLKCVKECNLGAKNDIEELIFSIKQETPFSIANFNNLQIESTCKDIENVSRNCHKGKALAIVASNIPTGTNNALVSTNNTSNDGIEFVDKINKKPVVVQVERTVPNLMSKVIEMKQVLSLQEIHNVQDKFAIIGGQDDFLKEMESYSIKPDIKTITQMLSLIEETKEAENKLMESMKSLEITADIDFYNMLIKKRCLRYDYDDAFDVKNLIEQESKTRKKNYHPWNKKAIIKSNIMTYGVLAMACKTKERAEELLMEMKEKQLKVNIEILGILLKNGITQTNFRYIIYIMNTVNDENLKPNDVFIKHIESFNEKCEYKIQQNEHNHEKDGKTSVYLATNYKMFLDFYGKWLNKVGIQEVLQEEHPWKQFKENYPETVQRQNIQIIEPKKFYKRKRGFKSYSVKL